MVLSLIHLLNYSPLPAAFNMPHPKVNLKDPMTAAFLAWLVPGLGHFYQARFFKSGLYAVCILGTFLCGLALGEGKVVHWRWDAGRKTLGYFAQVPVGALAVPALVQAYRQDPNVSHPDRSRNLLLQKLRGPFAGEIKRAGISPSEETQVFVEGEIELLPNPPQDFEWNDMTGQFKGTLRIAGPRPPDIPDGVPVELTLRTSRQIDPPVFPSPDREIECSFDGIFQLPGEARAIDGVLSGRVLGARGFVNRYAAPLDEVGLADANGRLGKFFELGLVFTWIAGLLNVLAIWDAFEGPAYGYSDEPDDEPAPAA